MSTETARKEHDAPRGHFERVVDQHGRFTYRPDTEGMHYPVACGCCGHVHDSGKVQITARYLDCDMWKCPACGGTQDNRWDLFPNSPSTARKLYR